MEVTFRDMYQHLEEYVLENFGEKCKDFELDCMICQQYLALNILEENLWLEETKGKKES